MNLEEIKFNFIKDLQIIISNRGVEGLSEVVRPFHLELAVV
jgi:hypothetical protein